MQGLVEISGVFLSCFSQSPENMILMEEEKKLKGFCFLHCVFSRTVHLQPYQWHSSQCIWMNPSNEIIIEWDLKT